MQAKLLVVVLVVAAALAGCGTKVPTGKLENANYATPVSGTSTILYQAFTSGGNPLPTPSPSANLTCAQDSVPQPDPTGNIHNCKGPYTNVKVVMSGLFLPNNAGTWSARFYSPSKAPLAIGDITLDNGNGTAMHNFTMDLSGKYDSVQILLADFVYATAPAAPGPQTFALAAGVNGLTVTGMYTGKHLDVTLAGLPARNGTGTYMGMLYLKNADGSTAPSPSESFPIAADGSYKYDSKDHNINDFAEFHVHVGDSKLNLYKAKIVPDA